MDMEIIFIDEDGGVEGDPLHQFEVPSTIIPGPNIKTGCYGLFLCEIDKSTCYSDTTKLNSAIEALDNIQDCVACSALSLYYPPDTLDTPSILKLADLVLLLEEQAGGMYDEKVTDDVRDEFAEVANNTLGMKAAALEGERIIDEQLAAIKQHIEKGLNEPL